MSSLSPLGPQGSPLNKTHATTGSEASLDPRLPEVRREGPDRHGFRTTAVAVGTTPTSNGYTTPFTISYQKSTDDTLQIELVDSGILSIVIGYNGKEARWSTLCSGGLTTSTDIRQIREVADLFCRNSTEAAWNLTQSLIDLPITSATHHPSCEAIYRERMPSGIGAEIIADRSNFLLLTITSPPPEAVCEITMSHPTTMTEEIVANIRKGLALIRKGDWSSIHTGASQIFADQFFLQDRAHSSFDATIINPQPPSLFTQAVFSWAPRYGLTVKPPRFAAWGDPEGVADALSGASRVAISNPVGSITDFRHITFAFTQDGGGEIQVSNDIGIKCSYCLPTPESPRHRMQEIELVVRKLREDSRCILSTIESIANGSVSSRFSANAEQPDYTRRIAELARWYEAAALVIGSDPISASRIFPLTQLDHASFSIVFNNPHLNRALSVAITTSGEQVISFSRNLNDRSGKVSRYVLPSERSLTTSRMIKILSPIIDPNLNVPSFILTTKTYLALWRMGG